MRSDPAHHLRQLSIRHEKSIPPIFSRQSARLTLLAADGAISTTCQVAAFDYVTGTLTLEPALEVARRSANRMNYQPMRKHRFWPCISAWIDIG